MIRRVSATLACHVADIPSAKYAAGRKNLDSAPRMQHKQIVISGHERPGSRGKREFKKFVILWVPAILNALNRDEPGRPWSVQYVSHLVPDGIAHRERFSRTCG